MVCTSERILGYQIDELLYDSAKTILYRGRRLTDQKPVVLKLLKNLQPTLAEQAELRHQYTLTQDLDLPGVIRTYGFEQNCDRPALVMEDFGGISLKQVMETWEAGGMIARPDGVREFLTLAIALTTSLDSLYRHRIIHKDIKPANILIHPLTRQVKLIDLSIATQLPRETQAIVNPNVLEGTLAYLSPEQTGRMNRGIDYRTDYYSLGVTLYELLTGQRPFDVTDPIEWVHCHIAKQPNPPHTVNPNIPVQISAIVLKLMAKNAEDRYQSPIGLRHDLEQCLSAWFVQSLHEPFELGTQDCCDRLVIPEKLYGRGSAIQTLLHAFERTRQGATELLLVAGASGLGKTAVVHEMHKPIVQQRGFFIQGKFDQLQRNTPLKAVVDALRDLIHQLLTESHDRVAQWKTQILEAVGTNGQLLIDVIPEVEWLIGPQPAVPTLDPTATQHRFNHVFQTFLQVFPRADHPLVLFLDDLQWADLASLQLLERLLGHDGVPYLLVIGSYRDNEVTPTHPLMLTVQSLLSNGTTLQTLTLTSMSQSDLHHLIRDALGGANRPATALTQLVFAKTQGNPFFSVQFLKALHEVGVIYFKPETREWICDLEPARSLGFTDDVVEFMAQQLQQLPTTTQDSLKLAACLGNQFNLATLALLHNQPLSITAQTLWPAIQEGWLLPITQGQFGDSAGMSHQVCAHGEFYPTTLSYQFLHDRVQQAAYSLIPSTHRAQTHLKIGQMLLENTAVSDREDCIFELVNQLNEGLNLITQVHDRLELAELNLIAGNKSKSATAYTTAYQYLSTGLSLLPETSWETNYSLTLDLHEAAAESAYLNTDFTAMEAWIQPVMDQAKTPLDRVNVSLVRLAAARAQDQGMAGIATGLEILQFLGVQIPTNPQPEDIEQAFRTMQITLGDRAIATLIDLPRMTNPEYLAAMEILPQLLPLVYIHQPLLLPLIVFAIVNLSLQFGNSAASASGYVAYGVLLWKLSQDIDACYQWGQLALKVLDQFQAPPLLRTNVLLPIYQFINPWKESLHHTSAKLLDSYSLALEAGALGDATFCTQGYLEQAFWWGKSLDRLEDEIAQHHTGMQQLKQAIAIQLNEINWQTVVQLRSAKFPASNLSIDILKAQETLALFEESRNEQALFYFHLKQLFLRYLFCQVNWAIAHAERAIHYLPSVPARIEIALLYFYYSLVLLSGYPQADSTDQPAILEQVATYQQQLRTWADHCPMNLQHKYELVEAKRHSVLGDYLAAIEGFDRAIELAKINGYVNDTALAYETAGQFYLTWEKPLMAKAYMENAYRTYEQWGAHAKSAHLQQTYPSLLSEIENTAPARDSDSTDASAIASVNFLTETSTTGQITLHQQNTISRSNTNGSSTKLAATLDMMTVLKASQALSGVIQLETLLSTLMQIVLEHAGAQSGVLILHQEGQWHIEAQAEYRAGKSQTLHTQCLQSIPIESSLSIPLSVIHYVMRTGESLVMDDAMEKTTTDPYILSRRLKSLLCAPIHNQGQMIGILYLENNLTTAAFTRDRLEVLNLLTTQAAISLHNALLYNTLEQKVAQRTQELHDRNQDLSTTLTQLKQTQAQLIQTEKMSSLGQMVAGIAHEINNPINFIHGNILHVDNYCQDLLQLVDAYHQTHPDLLDRLQQEEDIDLEFLVEDLQKIFQSMRNGSDRIRQIVLSLRNFSRLDESDVKEVDIHEGLDSTLVILQNRLKPKPKGTAITLTKKYDKLPLVTCYPSQLNQVFLNILSNAIDALDEYRAKKPSAEDVVIVPTLEIATEMVSRDRVRIRIRDNGPGMSEEVRQRIFDPFFTTKPVGSGTGLGLSVSYQIVETHKGQITCTSEPGVGTEFIVEISRNLT